MLVRFYNLGKIKETELDLRPMTVIIGPNNSNKTYIAYSLYGMWESMTLPDYSGLTATRIDMDDGTDGTFSVKVNHQLLQKLQSGCNELVGLFTQNLDTFYQDSSHRIFAETTFSVNISWEELLAALEYFSGKFLALAGLEYRLSLEHDNFIFRPESLPQPYAGEAPAPAPSSRAVGFEASFRLRAALLMRLFPPPFLLPAERNAFVITYKLLANRRYKMLRESQRYLFSSNPNANAQRQIDLLKESGEVRYPQPVEDFLDFLSDVETSRPSPSSNLTRLADMIEKNLQDANKTRYRPTALGGQEIVTSIGKGLEIDLYNASSSIKQLAPLLLYLRYRARENDLLIIDEPEMNLHPESQAKLLEILAILVNQGVHVLMTTHSPYLLAHLNNLAQGADGSETARRKQARSLYLKNPEALLRMDQISAYEMKDNQLQSLKDPDYGIQWRTLSDVAVDLQQKYFDLYETGHAQEKPKTARRTAKTSGSKNGQS